MAADRTPLSAQVVGIDFANQYYHILTHSPQLVVRFYNEGSMLIRLDSRGKMSSITGMDAIKEKLLSVDYSEYSADIKTVDAEELLDGGVTVLVIGYLTGNDDVKKKFSQSFLLATQDNGYYVLNDIFLLLDEANDQPSSSALTSGDTEPLAPEQAEQLEQHENPVPEEEKLDEAESVDPSAEISCSVKEEVQAGKEIDEVSKSFQAVALNPSSSTTLEEPPPRESYLSIVIKAMKKKPTPPVSLPVASKLAVVNTGQPASPTSIPTLVTENASVSPNAVDSYSTLEPEVVGYSIHIKNLPVDVTPAQLEEEFKKFGPIKPGGMQIRSFQQNGFSFGFVDFEAANAVARAIEEVGGSHAQSVGFSTDGFATTPTMRKLGLIWVTSQMHIEVHKYPAWGEVIEIETWCQSDGRMGTRRDWILKDFATGEVIGRATSKWVTMNQNTSKLQRIRDEVREEVFVHCPRTPRLSFPEANNGSLKKIPKLDDPAQYSRLGLVPRRADLDKNQHVNNVTYIGWVLESIPQEIIDTHELQTITLDYLRECQHNDIVDSLASPEVPEDGSTNGAVTSDSHANDQDLKQFLHVLRLSGSDLEINRGRTVWRKLAR